MKSFENASFLLQTGETRTFENGDVWASHILVSTPSPSIYTCSAPGDSRFHCFRASLVWKGENYRENESVDENI